MTLKFVSEVVGGRLLNENGIEVLRIDGTGQITGALFGAMGQCRLAKSGANLVLSPFQGSKITINGTSYTVPAAGVSLAPTGTAANTTYLIYALQTAGVLSLEYSATTHATDTSTTTGNLGQEIKSGDPTRTLVGQARTASAGAWVDTPQQRFVLSWFNRQTIACRAAFTANRNYPVGSYGEDNSEIKNEFLLWGGQTAIFAASGGVANATASYMNASIGVDSVSTPIDCYATGQVPANGQFPIGQSAPVEGLAEGYHYATLLATNSAGTAVFLGSATPGARCTLSTTIQG